MTYEEIKMTDKRYLTSEDIREILEAAAYNITLTARENPSGLPFPIIKIGSRVKIPRYSFLMFCENILGLDKDF